MLKKFLLAPGPTPVPPEALTAMAMPIIHHRSPDFLPILEEAKNSLKWLFQTENDVLILCSTGTGGMVGSVTNFMSPGDKALVVRGGKFGERWTEICTAYGVEAINIDVEWGYAVKPALIEKALKKDPSIKAVMIQASETSTAVMHDTEAIGKIVKKYPGTLFIVDAITALGVIDLPVDKCGVDVCVTGSQKALMLPPGLAFVSVSEKAWKFNETAKCNKFYFNFKKERANLAKNQTNFTSASSLIVGLNTVLRMMKAEGLENIFKRHARLADATRAAMKALGLKLYAKESPSTALTAVEVPAGIDGGALTKLMRDKYGVTVAGGQAQLKGKIFRIAHLGYFDTFDMIVGVSCVEMALKEMGYTKIKLGKGVAAAEEILMKF
ncbi:MAG: alanine--glyoxylate aminotransferase family protein [Nitrospirae bacterium]|nr:alanine--glyoxylate aminotransferase family protein [Nitrospirota bacterium]